MRILVNEAGTRGMEGRSAQEGDNFRKCVCVCVYVCVHAGTLKGVERETGEGGKRSLQD